jgi:hypothetical protein
VVRDKEEGGKGTPPRQRQTGNGTAPGSLGGRVGIGVQPWGSADPADLRLLNNVICGNRLGEISGPALDPTDAGNLTPTSTEGAGVSPSPGCDVTTNVYAFIGTPDGVASDDFSLAAGSPAVDAGLDPRTLGLPSALDPRFEADYAQEATRPRPGAATATAHRRGAGDRQRRRCRRHTRRREPDAHDLARPHAARHAGDGHGRLGYDRGP